MQFNVPQFIDVEDKILGPLSLKKLLLLCGGAIIIIFLWYFFKLWVVLILGGPLIGFLLAVIFVKINGLPFFSYLRAWLNFHSQPKTYTWQTQQKETKDQIEQL